MITILFSIFISLYALFFILILSKRKLNIDKRSHSDRVTIIVVYRNEEKNLPDLLDSLLHQNYPKELVEFVFVDDRSTDDSFKLVEAFFTKIIHKKHLIVHQLPDGKFGKKNGLELAINEASHDILMFTDADCICESNWIESTLQCFDESVQCVVGKSFLIPANSRLICFFQEAETFFNHMIAERSLTFEKGVMSFGRNFAYRKSSFDKINGFTAVEQSMSGDDDLVLSEFNKHGLKTVFNYESNVSSKTVSNWHEFYRQKTRHMSVSRFLPISYQISALLFHGTHFALMIIFLIIITMQSIAIILSFKFAIDLIVFWRMKKILEYKHGLRVYIVWSLFYWLYIPIITLLSYTRKTTQLNWK